VPITDLNHFFIRANDLERTKDFYVNVLGFEVMERPAFPFPGYWLGVNGKIQVHMGPHGIEHSDLYYLGSPPNAARDHTGVVDHIAFLADEPGEVKKRLDKHGVSYRPRYFSEAKLYQVFFKDPDGLLIELNFQGIADNPDWGGEDYSKMPQFQVRRRATA
jgi:catechol 2,3-dioxygenase-like lactoylglutathione lyase family enzyme